MFTLVIGGAASGKSEYAESRVTDLPGRRIYLATMRPWDQECRNRIDRHRRLRLGKGFETLERYTDLAGAEIPAGANVLLECMSNLTANELYDPEGGGREDEADRHWLSVVEITPETVKPAVNTLARPVSYSRTQVVETFWSGGSGQTPLQYSC